MGMDLAPWKAELDSSLLQRINGMAEELARQAADITAAEYRWLALLAAFDAVGVEGPCGHAGGDGRERGAAGDTRGVRDSRAARDGGPRLPPITAPRAARPSNDKPVHLCDSRQRGRTPLCQSARCPGARGDDERCRPQHLLATVAQLGLPL